MELQLAVDLANAFISDEIMSIFAQRVYLGANCYGVIDALKHRIRTTLQDATLADAVTLATLTRFPTLDAFPDRYAPRFRVVARQGAQARFWDDDTENRLIENGPTPFEDRENHPKPRHKNINNTYLSIY